MRVIPVIDLLDGQAAHAVKGERHNYRPVKSVLCDTSDPMMIARAYRDLLGLNEIYIADLNSIQGTRLAGHRQMIASLARSENFDIILDAGISESDDAAAWIDLGVRKVAVGTETLREFRVVQQLPSVIDRNRLVFSLDTRAGNILSPCPELTAMSPIEALDHLQSSGWREVIILDLSRVGTKEGIDRTILREAQAKFPDLHLMVGGGLANPGQLVELRNSGIAGVLLATALHRGSITAQHLSAIGENSG
jgi:phosphoribosylformimino-5-aminoimidazole carboxamide ribotide isomerase